MREVAADFGRRFGKAVTFQGTQSADALLSNAAESHRLFGRPRVGAEQMIAWITAWIEQGGETLGKPTHFEVRDGRF